jgi:predicted outer membrane repeat protein
MKQSGSFQKTWYTAAFAGLFFTLFALGAAETHAATLTVTSPLDDGSDGTLRHEIADAGSGDTITFAGDYTITVGGAGGTLMIDKNLTIDGAGHAVTVSGGGVTEVFWVNVGTTTFLNHLTITGGSSPNGGGIQNRGTMTISNSTISGNQASAGAGGGGGIANTGTLTVENSTFSGNSAFTSGGGIDNVGTLTVQNCTFSGNQAGFGGGIYTVAGTLTVQNCTFSGNSAPSGFGGGIYQSPGTLTVQNCTFSGNSANAGGGIYNDEGMLTVHNSTFSGNSANSGGGIYNGAGILTVQNSTLSGNSSGPGVGGGIYDDAGPVHLLNTIIANSPTGGDYAGAGLIVNYNNLIEDGSGSPFLSGDPNLGPLQDNGGPTQTMALLPGSPAIGQGNSANSLATDQRGYLRDATPDIGAFELNGVPPSPEMDLRQGMTAIADGGTYDFGGYSVGSNADAVFTIQNTGTANLTLTTPMTLGGANADQFSIQGQPASPVAPGGSTTFTVRFSPTSAGAKTAAISIVNNDSNENPYDFSVQGTGTSTPPPPDTDGDGTPDSLEQGPNGNDPNYDGNHDGTPDWQQSNVVSFTTFTDAGSHYLTLAVPAGLGVSAQGIGTPPALPAGVTLPFGCFTFTVTRLTSGQCIEAVLYLDGTAPVTYYKYGPTPDNPTAHWYDFSYDGETGAEVSGNTVILHLCDGKRGDQDLTENGTIVDPGGPAEPGLRPVLYFPYLVNGSGNETEIGIINKESYALSGTIEFFDTSGTALASRPISLPAKGKVSIASAAIPENAASAVVTADGQVAGYGRSLTATGQIFNDPGISKLADNITIPFTTSSSYWRSGIAVFNPGTEEVSVTIEDLAQGDTSMSLAAKAQQFFWVSGSPDRLIASGSIAAMEVFESTRSYGDLGAVALGEANGYELYVPSLLFSSGSFSGVGVRNRGLHEGTVTVQGFDGEGNVEEVALGAIMPRGQTKLDLTATLASDTLWAKITGASSASSPIGTPPLPLQGITVYGESGLTAVGALNLNALRFRRGMVGVVNAPNLLEMLTVPMLNPGATAARVTVTSYDSSGNISLEDEATIPPGGVWELQFSSSGDGYVLLESDADLYGYEIIRAGGKLELLPVLQ